MSAVFSPCRTWRYTLTRETEHGAVLRMAEEFHRGEPLTMPTVAFVGLNPSTADETQDDPTVRRCIGYADRWGYGRMVMLNVFAIRSTDPRKLRVVSLDEGVARLHELPADRARPMSRSADLTAEAFALLEQARAEGCVEIATLEARLAQFKLAAELERQGRLVEAKVVLDELDRTRPA